MLKTGLHVIFLNSDFSVDIASIYSRLIDLRHASLETDVVKDFFHHFHHMLSCEIK